jgi:hypothetical protein
MNSDSRSIEKRQLIFDESNRTDKIIVWFDPNSNLYPRFESIRRRIQLAVTLFWRGRREVPTLKRVQKRSGGVSYYLSYHIHVNPGAYIAQRHERVPIIVEGPVFAGTTSVIWAEKSLAKYLHPLDRYREKKYSISRIKPLRSLWFWE